MIRRLTTATLAFLLVSFAAAQQGPAPLSDEQLRDRLGAHQFARQDLEVLPAAHGEIAVTVEWDGVEYGIELTPHSVRHRDFNVIVADDAGLHGHQDLPEPETFRGVLRSLRTGAAVGRVAASVHGDEVRAIATRDDGRGFEIQPLRALDASHTGTIHVVVDHADLRGLPAGFCGSHPTLSQAQGAAVPTPVPPAGRGASQRGAGRPFLLAELAVDADFPFYQQFNDVNLTILDIEGLMNFVEFTFEDQVDITYELTILVIRASGGADPYSVTNPYLLLDQFQSQWSTQFAKAPRDVAHLLTHRNIDNFGVIGLANLAGVCSNSGYGLAKSLYFGSLTPRMTLSAHELGHGWGASHCDAQPDCGIMCAGFCGSLTQFGQSSQTTIEGFAAARAATCLDLEEAATALPLFDDFEGGIFDSSKWSYVRKAAISPNGVNDPSGVLAMKLNAIGPGQFQDDEVRSHELDLTGEGDHFVSFFAELRNMEAGETLQVDYYSQNFLWQPLLTLTSTGTSETAYTFHQVAVPGDGYHGRFRLRFKPDLDEGNDAVFIDDVHLSRGGMALTVSDLIGGQTAQLTSHGAAPLEQAYFIYSLTGSGAGPCFFGGTLCLDLQSPIFILTAPLSDTAGVAAVSLPIPAGTVGLSLSLQVVAVRGGGPDSIKTNTVTRTVQP